MERPLGIGTQAALVQLAVKSPEAEVCGFVTSDGIVHIIPNVSANPAHAFFMDPQLQIAFLKERHQDVIGVFHTHPGGSLEPSEQDIKGWHPAMPWRYFIVTVNQIMEWKKDGNDVSKLASYNAAGGESQEDMAVTVLGN